MQFLTSKTHANVGMYRFGYSPFGKPLLSVYCYRVDDLLIDTAQRNCEHKVLSTFQDHQINKVVLTHWHEDHAGNAETLANFHNAEIYAPQQCIDQLVNGFKILPYERFLFGSIRPITKEIHSVEEQIISQNYVLDPIFTPGHSKDHTAYLEKSEGWLFAGDLFVGVEIKVFRKGEQFWQQVESFKRVLEYDFEVIFCGHHPRLKGGKRWMQRKLQYFEDFGGKVQELYFQGNSTPEIIKIMNLSENLLTKILTSNDVSLFYMVEAACKPKTSLSE